MPVLSFEPYPETDLESLSTDDVLQLQGADRSALANASAAVVVELQGVLAVAEDLGDGAVVLARVEHRRRGYVAELEHRHV
jgi:hypothetical protein